MDDSRRQATTNNLPLFNVKQRSNSHLDHSHRDANLHIVYGFNAISLHRLRNRIQSQTRTMRASIYLLEEFVHLIDTNYQQPTCHAFVDPYVEHDSLTILLDLILLKRGVYRHLLYNRGTKPRRLTGRKEKDSEVQESGTNSKKEFVRMKADPVFGKKNLNCKGLLTGPLVISRPTRMSTHSRRCM